MPKEFLTPTRGINELQDAFYDGLNNRTINIMFEDENSLSFDVWDDSKEPEQCIFSLTVNLKTGNGKITVQKGR